MGLIEKDMKNAVKEAKEIYKEYHDSIPIPKAAQSAPLLSTSEIDIHPG